MTPSDRQGNRRLFTQQLDAVGARLRALRTARTWSQRDLSDRTGIIQASVSEIETGKLNISLQMLWRLANALEMHWADLLDDRRSGPPQLHTSPVSFEEQLHAFGDRLYQARVIQRISQQQLADRTGISRSAISTIETGTQNVQLETLSRLAAGLQVHWADLLDDRTDTPPRPPRSQAGPSA